MNWLWELYEEESNMEFLAVGPTLAQDSSTGKNGLIRIAKISTRARSNTLPWEAFVASYFHLSFITLLYTPCFGELFWAGLFSGFADLLMFFHCFSRNADSFHECGPLSLQASLACSGSAHPCVLKDGWAPKPLVCNAYIFSYTCIHTCICGMCV